jgi:hypothetical protein
MEARRGPVALRSRPAGGGCKPPQGAAVKSRGAERCGKGAPRARQVRAEKANASEPLMTCRNAIDDIETEGRSGLGTSLAGACRLARRCPAWRWRELGSGSGVERGNLSSRWAAGQWRGVGLRLVVTRDLQAAETARGSVAMRGTGADRLVVAVRPGNAGGAKGTGRPDGFGGQPASAGRSR